MSPAIDYAKIADLYDSYVRFDDDMPFFLDECRDVAGPVLELMSGTGRVSVPLLQAGVPLTCVDSSPQMLQVLRRKLAARGLAASVVKQDVTRLRLPTTYDLALIPFNSFAELITEDAQRAAILSIFDALAPGGKLICTLHNPPVRLQSVGRGMATLARFPIEGEAGQLVLKADFAYDPTRKLVHGFEIFERVSEKGETVSARKLPVQFALIDPASFEELVRSAGFEVEELFGDYRRSPFSPQTSPYTIWSLRKPRV